MPVSISVLPRRIPPSISTGTSPRSFGLGVKDGRSDKILITGTTSGIGLGLMKAYQAQGRAVISVHRWRHGLEQGPYVADVRDRELAEHILTTELTSGGRLPSVYILNAGMNQEDAARDFCVARFQETMDVNLYGVLNFLAPAIRLHRARGDVATFVALSSTSNLYPNPRCLGYYASKLLLHKLFLQFDRLYRADGLRFKTVILGPVATNIAVNATLPRWQQWVRQQITISVDQAVSAIVPFIESTRRTLYYPKLACAVYLGARLLR